MLKMSINCNQRPYLTSGVIEAKSNAAEGNVRGLEGYRRVSWAVSCSSSRSWPVVQSEREMARIS